MSKRYWEWEAPFEIKPEETALVLVDMQKGFVEEGRPLYTPNAVATLPAMADFKKFAKDYGIPVFLSAFVQDEDFHHEFYWTRSKERGIMREDGSLVSMERDTRDGEIADELEPEDDDIIFEKYAYSCFADTDFENQLEAKGIKTLLIGGTVTNWCVDSTIRDAFHKHYNVVALADLISSYPHAGATTDQWDNMLFDFWAEAFGRVIKTDEAKEEISKNSRK